MLRPTWHCYALFPLLVATLASADTGTWTPLGPEGGSFDALAVDPDDPEIVYVVAHGGALHRRLASSAPWEFAGQTAIETIATAADGRLYAGGFGNMYRSGDHGSTYSRVYLGSMFIEALAVDPHDVDTVYAATRPVPDATATRIYRSSDGGRSWTAVSDALPPTNFVAGFFVDPDASSTLRIAFLDDTVRQSDDGGVTWRPIDEGLPCDAQAPCLSRFAMLPGDSPALLVGTQDGGIFRSIDGGGHWGATTLAGGGFVTAIAGNDGGVAYAATNGASGIAIFRSDDRGTSWQQTASAPPAIVEQLAVSGDILFAATEDGFYVSVDGGASWQLDQAGLNAMCSLFLAAADGTRTTLYTGVTANGVLVGPDASGGWSRAASPSAFVGNDVAVDPNDALRSVAPTYAGPAVSSDGGLTYEPASDQSFFYRTLMIDPRYGDVMYAAVYPNAVWKSSDAGHTWDTVFASDTLGDIWDLAADPASGRVYALYAHALVASGDGTRWDEILHTSSPNDTFHEVEVAPTSPATLFVDGSDVVRVSHDGGRRWQPLSFPGSIAVINDIAVDPSRARTVYATNARDGDQVYRSDDAGVTWRPVGEPIDGVISQLAVDPHEGDIVYATICGRGVHKLTQDAASTSGDTDGCQIGERPTSAGAGVLAAHAVLLGLLVAARRRRTPLVPALTRRV